LKPNAGSENKLQYQQAKSKRFFGDKKQHSEHKGARNFQKKKQKRYTINAVQSIPFSNEKSP